MARGQRDASKEHYWRRHLRSWQRSGQSVRAYCAAAGLSEPSFYAWRRVLADRSGAARPKGGRGVGADRAAAAPGSNPATDSGGSTADLVPVRIVADGTSATAPIEIVLRGGRIVRVPPGFAAPTLQAIVAALEDLPC